MRGMGHGRILTRRESPEQSDDQPVSLDLPIIISNSMNSPPPLNISLQSILHNQISLQDQIRELWEGLDTDEDQTELEEFDMQSLDNDHQLLPKFSETFSPYEVDDPTQSSSTIVEDYHAILKISNFQLEWENVPFHELLRLSDPHAEMHPHPEHFFQMEYTPSWIDDPRLDSPAILEELYKYALNKSKKTGWKPYNVKHLPQITEYNLEGEASCHVIRYRSPSEFHVIFSENLEWFNLGLQNSKWMHFLKKWEDYINYGTVNQDILEQKLKLRASKYCFQNPLQLYSGIKYLLSKFIVYISSEEHQSAVEEAKAVTLNLGDLVIVRKKEGGRSIPYRGAITEPAKVVVDENKDALEGCFIVYLLDTGERRVVSRRHLIPLPKPFIGFAPLAIPCSLHGVYPIFKGEWTGQAHHVMAKLIKPDGEFRGNFHVGFEPREPARYLVSGEEIPIPLSYRLIYKLVDSAPYPVNLFHKYQNFGKIITMAEILLRDTEFVIHDLNEQMTFSMWEEASTTSESFEDIINRFASLTLPKWDEEEDDKTSGQDVVTQIFKNLFSKM